MPIVSGVLASRRNSRMTTVVFLTTCVFLAQGITRNEAREVITSWNGDNAVEDDGDDVEGVNAFVQVGVASRTPTKVWLGDKDKVRACLEKIGAEVQAKTTSSNSRNPTVDTSKLFLASTAEKPPRLFTPTAEEVQENLMQICGKQFSDNAQFLQFMADLLISARKNACGYFEVEWPTEGHGFLGFGRTTDSMKKSLDLMRFKLGSLGEEVEYLTGTEPKEPMVQAPAPGSPGFATLFAVAINQREVYREDRVKRATDYLNGRVIPALLLWHWFGIVLVGMDPKYVMNSKIDMSRLLPHASLEKLTNAPDLV
ncbi:unnamed protein product [Amoebophrya sp. A25]|nr:unnamed protein product [Amoebophrya sp. A25]|eukprot:GSA25T00007231001.1